MNTKKTLEEYISPSMEVFSSLIPGSILCTSELNSTNSNGIEEFELIEW